MDTAAVRLAAGVIVPLVAAAVLLTWTLGAGLGIIVYLAIAAVVGGYGALRSGDPDLADWIGGVLWPIGLWTILRDSFLQERSDG